MPSEIVEWKFEGPITLGPVMKEYFEKKFGEAGKAFAENDSKAFFEEIAKKVYFDKPSYPGIGAKLQTLLNDSSNKTFKVPKIKLTLTPEWAPATLDVAKTELSKAVELACWDALSKHAQDTDLVKNGKVTLDGSVTVEG